MSRSAEPLVPEHLTRWPERDEDIEAVLVGLALYFRAVWDQWYMWPSFDCESVAEELTN